MAKAWLGAAAAAGTGPSSVPRPTAPAGQASTTMYGSKASPFRGRTDSHVGELIFALIVEVALYLFVGLIFFRQYHGG